MKLTVHAAGIATLDQELGTGAEFRKASSSMRLASAAIEALVPSVNLRDLGSRLAVVLGTSHGELDATIQFLKHLGASGIGRPFLFQNSLHNATLGFLSQRFGLQGPGLTVSGGPASGEDAIETAWDLLGGGGLTHALVMGVDATPEGFETILAETYTSPVRLGAGAAALLVSRSAGEGIASLTDVRREKSAPFTCDTPYYDSNAVEKVARAIAELGSRHELRLPKPDGSIVTISLERKPA